MTSRSGKLPTDSTRIGASSRLTIGQLESDEVRAGELVAPSQLRRRAEQLSGQRAEKKRRVKKLDRQVEQIDQFLAIADDVSNALQTLSQQLFEELLGLLQSKLSVALEEVLGQRIEFVAEADFKRGSAVVEFSVCRDGHPENIYYGQGGSVLNVLSVGLRIFALASLDEQEHRRFLVLDEQDCWLRPELVPKLVRIVYEAARELDFQVIMISHHDVGLFERYADRIYRLVSEGSSVHVEEVGAMPPEIDSDSSG